MSTRGASPPSPTLHGRWLLLARVAWVAVAIAALGVFVISVPAHSPSSSRSPFDRVARAASAGDRHSVR